ncbi:MAG TPA: PDZ domain-containing protein [Dokdonella sp.]
MTLRLAAVAALLVLTGCASLVRESAPGGADAAPPAYVAEPGRDAATIAQMRAAPPPETPSLVEGRNPLGDQNRLAAQGFVRIGTAHYAADVGVAQAHDDAARLGRTVGADRVMVYAPAAAGATPPAWLAAYYVRFKLPFGATFRDLTPAERAALDGAGGGVAIGTVVGGSPAERANLLSGDVVTALGDAPVADRASFQRLLRANAGRAVTLTVVRNGETLRRVVRLGAVATEPH